MPFRSRRVMDRTTRRMPCEPFIADPWHSGLVLDLSARDLLVQTKARLRPHERAELRIACNGTGALQLLVEVARLGPKFLDVEQLCPPSTHRASGDEP